MAEATDWQFATIYEPIAQAVPDRPALVVPSIGRAPSGKVDYKTLRAAARVELDR